jgi:tetratricopeptide (TPR) repeat protein
MPIAKGDLSELVNKIPSLERWELDNLYTRGRDCFKERNWKEAIGCFLLILRWEPDYEEVYDKLREARRKEKVEDFFAKGVAYRTEGTWQEAEKMFSRVLELEPGYKLAIVEQAYTRGMACFGKKQWEKALEQFMQVLKLDATRKDATDKLKETSLILVSGFPEKRLEDAIRLLERVSPFVKDDVSFSAKLREIKTKKRLKDLYEEGVNYLGARKWQKANEKFTWVYNKDPNYRNVAALLKETESRLSDIHAEPSKFFKWWDNQSMETRIGLIGLVIAIILGIPSLYEMFHREERSAPTISTSASTFTPMLAGSQTPTEPATFASTTLCNGDFETSHFACWEHDGALSQSIDCSGGNCVALLGDLDYSCVEGVPIGEARICQTFKVPPNGVPKLSFRYRVRSFDILDSVKGGDSFKVYIKQSDADEKMILQVGNTDWNESDCNGDPWDSGWESFSYSINAYKGQNVTLCFHNLNEKDNSWNTWTYVDDVMVIP